MMVNTLGALYALYERALEKILKLEGAGPACRQGCAGCCTCNVTVTSLEVEFLFLRLGSQAKQRVVKKVKDNFPEKRYIPALTTNGFVQACMSGQETPEEENDPLWGQCPLLENNLCTVYESRPFGCRAMMSEVSCEKTGYARMPPRVLTLNNIFLQYIEQMDQPGVFGNLSDMILLFSEAGYTRPDPDRTGRHFIRNQKIPVLMIPPEDRAAMAPVVREITALT